jgi:hypothetical protein
MGQKSQGSCEKTISRTSKEPAWEGKNFVAVHGDFRMQFISKVSRNILFKATRKNEIKDRDLQDAKYFLQKARELSGTVDKGLTVKDFQEWGDMLGEGRDQTRAIVKGALKSILGAELPGIAQELKTAVLKQVDDTC